MDGKCLNMLKSIRIVLKLDLLYICVASYVVFHKMSSQAIDTGLAKTKVNNNS